MMFYSYIQSPCKSDRNVALALSLAYNTTNLVVQESVGFVDA